MSLLTSLVDWLSLACFKAIFSSPIHYRSF